MSTGPILIFDSGMGGLTVHAEIEKLLPSVSTVFAADTAAFPYGRLAPETLIRRVDEVIGALAVRYRPVAIVVACNTASTLMLPVLRAKHKCPVVGTVPAIKPAAERTKSGLISVLATPATVKREYTADLVRSFAAQCDVTLVGSSSLASLAEAHLCGEPVDDDLIRAEIAPCFVEKEDRRTDIVVLACTHYPLLVDVFARLAPWPVTWIDPAPAIARRVRDMLGEKARGNGSATHHGVITSDGAALKALSRTFSRFGLTQIEVLPLPWRRI